MEITSDNIQDIQDLAKKISEFSEIKNRLPEDPTVELPGGFLNPDGSIVKVATVRELNGYDEEIIARGGNRAIMLNTILSRGLEKIGYKTPTTDDLDSLLAGDRDAILLGIRKLTFGKTVNGTTVCPGCGVRQDVLIDLDEDIETKELTDPLNDRIFEIDLKAGKAVVGLPNGIVQKQLADNLTKSTPERMTIFLSGCLVSIDDEPSIGLSSALKLGILDRENLLAEITSRNPGPRLEAVVKACKACGVEISVPLSLADLFRL